MIGDEEPRRLEMRAHVPLAHLSPLSSPTTFMTLLLPQTSAPGVSLGQSQRGGKELRLFSFHCDFQSAFTALAHMLFSFNCHIPTTLITQHLIKVPPRLSCTTLTLPSPLQGGL